jgi:hypothetical protein
MEGIIQLKKSVVREFEFSYEVCSISENKFIELLGYDAEFIPEPVLEAINYILKNLSEKVRLQSGYKIFDPRKVKFNDFNFIIDNKIFNCGKIIYAPLKNSDTLAILVATVGEEIEKWSKYFMNHNEILKGYLVDKIASQLVEDLTDKTELLLGNQLKEIELKTTNRYSPGHCGWNVADQQILFSLLPNKFCGVLVNSNSMMIPIKSVSAVIGVGKNVEQKDYECSICDLEFCYKRERNV